MTDTTTMFANMLGLGPVLAAINDPSFHRQVAGFVAAVTDVQQRVARIEQKLDLLMGTHNANPAIAFTDLGAAGAGARAVAGGAVDDGPGGAAASPGGAGGGAGALRTDGLNGAAEP
jgi:hypothetical protein